MARTIAFTNYKGGVGKTTVATNVGYAMAHMSDEPVLLVDGDSSGNATLVTTGSTDYPESKTLSAVITADIQDAPSVVNNCIIQTKWHPNLHIIPANPSLQEAQRQLSGKPGAPFRLGRALTGIQSSYSAIIFDTQPSFSILTEMALLASTLAFIPIEPRYLSTAGLQQILQSIDEIRDGWKHHSLRVGGVLLTKFDTRIRGHREIAAGLQQNSEFGKMFVGIIPANEAIAYSQNDHKSIFDYAPESSASQAFARFVVEAILQKKGS
jgi:chromosome partitioning protein